MTNITLLDNDQAEVIRNITANRATHTFKFGSNVRIPIFVAYQGEGTTKPATGRATCRLCGQKIKHGIQLSFYWDQEDNSWTAKEYHVHADGCPNNKVATCPDCNSNVTETGACTIPCGE